MNIIKWLRKKLNWLTSKTFLIRESEKRFKEDGKPIPKPVYTYSYNKMQQLIIPEWKDLSSFTSNYKNTSNTSNTSNTNNNNKKKEDNNCKNCNNYNDFLHINRKKEILNKNKENINNTLLTLVTNDTIDTNVTIDNNNWPEKDLERLRNATNNEILKDFEKVTPVTLVTAVTALGGTPQLGIIGKKETNNTFCGVAEALPISRNQCNQCNLNFNKKKEEKPLKPLEPSISYINPYREVIYNLDGLSGSSGSQREKDDNWSEKDLEKLRNAKDNEI